MISNVNTQTVPLPEAAPPPTLNPSGLDKPAFLLNYPFSYSADQANNAWMKEVKPGDRKIDVHKAARQFMELYHFVASEALVYVLPTPAGCTLQDLVFTANLGIVLEHLADKNTVILSNHATKPRMGETEVGLRFFESMGYRALVPPFKFEGEADLKHLYDNVYIGGYGTRSELKAYEWMEQQFGMTIIKVEEVDDYLYHLDTTVFPLTTELTLLCTEMFEPGEIDEIEKHTEIIDVTADECYSGICNSVRLFNTILNGSHIHDLHARTNEYREEIAKNRKLDDIAAEHAFEVNYFNLSEYHKGGALLSCMMLHLNRTSYRIDLL